jgi:hypothetical protein
MKAMDDWFADILGRDLDSYAEPRNFHSRGPGGHGGARGLGLGGGGAGHGRKHSMSNINNWYGGCL